MEKEVIKVKSINPLQEFKEKLTNELYPDAKDSLKNGLCIQCKMPALENCYSNEGIKEYKMSGLCEKCFDEMFEDMDEED
jgi:hypothetical protein